MTDDDVYAPVHYCEKTSLECIEAMEIAFGTKRVANWCLLNCFKYLWRCEYKGGEKDLDKAEWYLDWVSKNDPTIVHDGEEWFMLEKTLENLRIRLEERDDGDKSDVT